jgi:hypothetical protein
MEVVGVFYGHLVHFTVFCYILWTFGIVCGNLVFFPVLVFCNKKNLATLPVNKAVDVIEQLEKGLEEEEGKTEVPGHTTDLALPAVPFVGSGLFRS